MKELVNHVRSSPDIAFLRAGGEMGKRIAEFAWETHPLGPPRLWPQSLKTAVSLILNSQHPMWIGWGTDMSFLYNDAYVHVLGLAKHPWALGRPAPEVWAEIWDVCGPLAEKVFRFGEPSFVDNVRLFMNRGDFLEETYYSFSYSPIRDESGGVGGLFCPSNDVSNNVIGARRLRTLSQIAADAYAEKTAEAACASAAAALTQNPDDVPFAMLYVSDGQPAMLEQSVGACDAFAHIVWPIAEVLRDGVPQRISIKDVKNPPLGSADQPVKEAIALPVTAGAENRPVGALVAGVSPTRQLDADYSSFLSLLASSIGTAVQNARAAEHEKRRADVLAEMDRAKTAFFSNVSHEFRTPLTLMLGPLEELARIEDERHRVLAQTAQRNSLRLLKLVNTLLEFSRLEAGHSDAAFVKTDLAALTKDLAGAFQGAVEDAGLKFSLEIELSEPVFVDRSMWERIVLNLLSNALKFTLEGEIAVTLRRVNGSARLQVTDTGAGIAPEELPHLFERFHRVRGAKSRSYEGSGIGLALVKDLVDLHGGRVDVESAVGKGTTFTIGIPLGHQHLDASMIAPAGDTLPYSSAVAQYLADVDATMGSSTKALSALPSTGGGHRRILLADDNGDLREYVARILAPRYDVVAVNNGAEALRRLKEETYDLVISDVMMPELDGFELLKAVRNDDRLATIPFIMLSARAGEESAVEGLLSGADDYLAKPFSSEELLARVYAHLSAATLREGAVKVLRESEERFRTLTASMPHVVFESDTNAQITFLSDEFRNLTGLPPEAGYGSAWAAVVHPDDLPVTARKWTTAMRTGEAFSNEFRMRRHDGVYRWQFARALPQRDAQGRIFRWTGTVNDIHDQRRAAQERDLLADAGRTLGNALDLHTTLRSLAELTIPQFGDWCQIDLRMDDGRIKTLAIAHRDSQKNELAQQFVGRVHLNIEADAGSPYVIRTGRSQVIPDVPPGLAEDAIGDPEEYRMYRELGLSSVAAVPITDEGKTLGMLAVLYSDSGRRHSEEDIPLLEELGRRAGLAIQRARLFEREHRVAESLQEASLPSMLPQVPGFAFDAVYAPGSAEALIGGDWYDAVRLIDGRLVISIGDVAGSGLQAAVIMTNMRQIIRGIAQVHADPALMLDAADRALRLDHPDRFVTAFVAVLDPVTNTLAYASAGHPPAILRRAGGALQMLSDGGLPLGLRGRHDDSHGAVIDFAQGDAIVLYTDGLTEFEQDSLAGETRLRTLLVNDTIVSSARPARALMDAALDGSASKDDIAVLIVQSEKTDERCRRLIQQWRFDAHDADFAGGVRGELRAEFQRRGAGEGDASNAELVLGELLGNVVRYAAGMVEVLVDWSGPAPVLHVLDRGPGFRHIAMLPRDIFSESGRGLYIVASLTQDFHVSHRPGGGSHARAVLSLRSQELGPAKVSAHETLIASLTR